MRDAAMYNKLEVAGLLKGFAYDTHWPAYRDAGILNLPVSDLTKILMTPDLGDLLTLSGVAQVMRAVPSFAVEFGSELMRPVSDLVDKRSRQQMKKGDR